MEGKPPGEGFGPGSPGYGPGAGPPDDEEDKGPQSPAPGSGPQSPAPGPPPSPGGADAPPQPPGGGYAPPQPPGGGYAPPPAPEAPPGAAPRYGGPVPPGGWQQPMGQPGGGYQPQGRLAGWGSRAGAVLLDALILLIPSAVLIAIVVGAFVSSDAAGIVSIIVGVLVYFVITLFYAPVLMARQGAHNGKTFGKQIVGIRVTRDNGQPFDLGQGFLREFVVKGLLFGFVGGFFFSIPTIVDYLWPLWDDQNRTLHDMVVSTHVVTA